MEHTKLALSAVMIVAVGLVGTNFVTGLEMTDQEQLDAQASGSIYGHITIVQSDSDGNILSYAQTDNIVTNKGKDCMAKLVFNATTTNCESADVGNPTPFNTIALFDGQSFPAGTNVTSANSILAPLIAASSLTEGAFPGLGRILSVVTEETIASDAGTPYVDTDDLGTVTKITNTFTAGAGVTGKNVDGAALLNDDEDAVLAAQTFTAVSLTTGDTLAITWLITIG